MKEIVNRLHENRQIELAKEILESNGYKVSRVNESTVQDVEDFLKSNNYGWYKRDIYEPSYKWDNIHPIIYVDLIMRKGYIQRASQMRYANDRINFTVPAGTTDIDAIHNFAENYFREFLTDHPDYMSEDIEVPKEENSRKIVRSTGGNPDRDPYYTE